MKRMQRYILGVIITFVLGIVIVMLPDECRAETVLPQLPADSRYEILNSLKLTEATDAMTTTKAKAGTRLVAGLAGPEFDISGYDYLHLWIYVSDDTILYNNNGDGLELASGGTYDQEENSLNFYYDKAAMPTINSDYSKLQAGWNEYLLKISDFKISTGGSLKLAELDYIGLVLRSNPAGLTFAMSEIYAVKEEDVILTGMGTFPENSGIPVIPLMDARYQLADTALQLTDSVAYATAAGANKYFRLTPALTEEVLDISECDYIYLWVYVSATDLTNGDSIELCSGGKQDSNESAARFNALSQGGLKQGWNELLIPKGEFSYDSKDGGLDEAALNFIGVVLRSASSVQTGAVSMIYAVKEEEVTDFTPECPITEAIPVETARYTLKDSALQLTKEAVWGTSAEAGKYMRLVPELSQNSFDLSEYDYIYTWIYLTADDLAAGDSIELSSSGLKDKEENAVRFNTWNHDKLKVGWNEVMVSVDEFVYTTGGELDYADLNYIGVVLRSASGELTAVVSEMYAVKSVDFEDKNSSGDQTIMGNGKLNRGDIIYDFAEAAAQKQNGVWTLSAELEKPAQPGYYTYLCAEIYIENKELLSRQQAYLTISSSKAEKAQELSYRLTKQSLQEGWNTVFLPIVDFRMSGYSYTEDGYAGLCDLLNIRRIGIQWSVRAQSDEKEAVLKLGKISLTNSLVTEDIPEGEYILEDSALALTRGEVSTTVTTGDSSQLARLMPEINYGSGYSVDISEKQYLYFWLYISEAEAEADGSLDAGRELELCSGGKCDEEENAIRLYQISDSKEGEPWLMSGDYGSFETGWNEYLVPIEDLTRVTNKSGDASVGCDFAAVNYLRIYFRTMMSSEAKEVTYGISKVYAVNLSDFAGTEGDEPESSEDGENTESPEGSGGATEESEGDDGSTESSEGSGGSTENAEAGSESAETEENKNSGIETITGEITGDVDEGTKTETVITSPETGDSNSVMWSILLIVSLIGIAGFGMIQRGRNN
ncbi:MAG: hypothetical protein J6B06_07150 [Lachnospiraceae bacterium]|nr:hypothetical protein [Lachnospiraceae bacterium]